MTKKEALSTVSALPRYKRLKFDEVHTQYKIIQQEDPSKAVSPTKIQARIESRSMSTVYTYLPLVRAIEGPDDGEEDAEDVTLGAETSYEFPSELSALIAPLQKSVEAFPEAFGRIFASTVGAEVTRVRQSFAQERFSLEEAVQKAKSQTAELNKDTLIIAAESDECGDQLVVANAANEELKQQLGTTTEALSHASAEIKELGALQQVAQARIAGLVDLGEAHLREVAIVKAEKDVQMKRAEKAEDENRELRQLREQANERSKTDMADLQARHAAEVAALRQEFSRDVLVERDRVSLELALVNALGTAVDANAARQEVSHV